MSNKIGILNHKYTGKIIFTFSLMVSLFWISSQQFNVYQHAVLGAFFELLAIPMLLLYVVLHTVSFIILIKERFSFKTYAFYSFLLLFATFIFVVYGGKGFSW